MARQPHGYPHRPQALNNSGSNTKAAQRPDPAPPYGKGDRGVQLPAGQPGKIKPAGHAALPTRLGSVLDRQGCQRGAKSRLLVGAGSSSGAARAGGWSPVGFCLPQPSQTHPHRVGRWRSVRRRGGARPGRSAHGRALARGVNEPGGVEGDSSDSSNLLMAALLKYFW